MFKKNYLDLLFNDALTDFIKANGVVAIQQTNTKDFVNGTVVAKVPTNRKAITDLLQGARHIHKTDIPSDELSCLESSFIRYKDDRNYGDYSRLAYNNIFRNVTDRIIKIDQEMSFNDALNMAIKFRNKLGSKFYGTLFRVSNGPNTNESNILINPFHILTTLALISEYGQKRSGCMDVKNMKFKPIIYLIDKEEDQDILYHSIYADMDKINKNIDCLMHVFNSKTVSKTKIISSNVENLTDEDLNAIKKGTKDIEIQYIQTIDANEDNGENENETYNHYVNAHQAMADGIVAPFYGASLIRIKKNLSESKGTRLTPMPTANISGSTNQFSGNPVFDNVCTGSTYANTSMDGLRNQTYVNYGSPYGSSKTYMPGVLMYIRRMIERSLDIYRRVGLFEIEEPEDVAINYEQMIADLKAYSLVNFGNETGNVFRIWKSEVLKKIERDVSVSDENDNED